MGWDKKSIRTAVQRYFQKILAVQTLSLIHIYKYSWGNSISKQKIIKDAVSLPKRKQFDHIKMQTLISAIQKLVIKEVVVYADKKIEATKNVAYKYTCDDQ